LSGAVADLTGVVTNLTGVVSGLSGVVKQLAEVAHEQAATAQTHEKRLDRVEVTVEAILEDLKRHREGRE
jgi:arginine decarboxylase-like protein